MKNSFSPNNRIKTFILLAICVLSAIGAVVIGIDDNLPGILLAFLAATCFILAFVHPWCTPRKFLFLLLAAVLGLILFVALFILIDITAQNPVTPLALRELTESPAFEITSIIIAMILPAAILIGMVGWIVMLIRSRRVH
jgi:hypothetical protein